MLSGRILLMIALILVVLTMFSCGRSEGWFAPCERNDDCGQGQTDDGKIDLECIATGEVRDPFCTATCSLKREAEMLIGHCIPGDYDSASDKLSGQCGEGCCLIGSITGTEEEGDEYAHGWCVPGI